MLTRERNAPFAEPMDAAVRAVIPDDHILANSGTRWPGFLVSQKDSPPFGFDLPSFPHHTLSVALGESPFRMTQTVGGRTEDAVFSRGTVTVSPAGRPATVRWYARAHSLHVVFEAAFLEDVSAHAFPHRRAVELVARFQVRDPVVERLGLALRAEVSAVAPLPSLYGESLGVALAVHLLEHHSAFPLAADRCPGGLSVPRLRRAMEFIHANLATTFSLADLAASVEVSPYHFARLFKQSTGLAPHQCVVKLRVERAEGLLLAADRLALVEIAGEVGFADQAHFTRHFKRLVGVTPGQYSRAGGGHRREGVDE